MLDDSIDTSVLIMRLVDAIEKQNELDQERNELLKKIATKVGHLS